MTASDSAPDFGRVCAGLTPFSFDGKGALPAAFAEYCRFYQIDFPQLPGVKHLAGTLSSGDCTLVVQCWLPEDPRGTVFVVHGYFDHVGIYRHGIEYFLRRGFAVLSYDQPGHGLSSGERASIGSFSEYVYALQNVIDLVFDGCPEPWHILGQSMGGAVVMTHLLDREFTLQNSPFNEVVLLAPLVYPRGWLWGGWLHALLKGLVRTRPRDFAINSHDRAFVDFVRERDPLQSRLLPMQWVTALKAWITEFEHLPRSELRPVIIQGTDDDTVDWQANIRRIGEKFPLSTVHYVSGARHHMVNESVEFRAKILELLDDRFDRTDSE